MADPLGLCSICGGDDLHSGDDGFFYCSACGSQSQQFQEQALDYQETLNMATTTVRRPQRPLHPVPEGDAGLLKSELVFEPHQGIFSQRASQFDDTQPWSASGWSQYDYQGVMQKPVDAKEAREMAASAVRKCYVEGLQELIQMQCETLVQKFGVSPLICGMVGSIWLRFIAFTRVFEKDWATEVIGLEEAREERRREKKLRSELDKDSKSQKREGKESMQEPKTFHGTKASLVWLAALKERIPIAAALAMTYLACHVAREPVLPTDIVNWALEGSLPYLAAFLQIGQKSGAHPLPLEAKLMFKPANVVSARKLELMAASIARRAGLQLPPVNFHAISCRLLKQLKLPVEQLSLHVWRFLDWYTPSGLWLSDETRALPSRVYVMAMVTIVLKVLYKIDGQGHWEKGLSSVEDSHKEVDTGACSNTGEDHPETTHVTSASGGQMPSVAKQECGKSFSASEEKVDSDTPVHDPSLPRDVDDRKGTWGTSFDNSSRSCYHQENMWSGHLLLGKLVRFLQDQKSVRFDYEKDLKTYLKYCQDVVFSGLKTEVEVENMCQRLWRLYEQSPEKETFKVKEEPYSPERAKPGFSSISGGSQFSYATSKDGQNTELEERMRQPNVFMTDMNREKPEKASKYGVRDGQEGGSLSSFESLDEIICRMEDMGFSYLPPLKEPVPSEKYLRYVRKKTKGTRTERFLHVDYFILICACSKVISVDPMALYWCVQRVENGLRWIEGKVKNVIQAEVQKLL